MVKDELSSLIQHKLHAGDVTAALRLLREHGRPRDAAALLAQLRRYAEAASAYAELGEYREAARCHERAGNAEQAAAAYRRAGDEPAAERSLREAGRTLVLAQLLVSQGRVDEAAALLAEVPPTDRRFVRSRVRLGRLSEQRKDWSGAREAYDLALRYTGLTRDTAPLALRSAQLAVGTGDRSAGLARVDDLERLGLISETMRPAVDRLRRDELGAGDSRAASGRAGRDAPPTPPVVPELPPDWRTPPTPPASSAGLLEAEPRVAMRQPTGLDIGGSPEPVWPDPNMTAPATPQSIANRQRRVPPSAAFPKHPRYQFRRELGRGGMGVVYEAIDREENRALVVKVLQNTSLPQSQAKDLFLREAMMVSYLSHPNIVTVYDFGHIDDHPYIVMEHVPGRDLGQVVKHAVGGRLSVAEVVPLFEQICAALDYAHGQRIIHRDIKLSNIMVTPDGTAKLLDFGLAQAIHTAGMTDEQLLGTPQYMAPELIQQLDHDHRVDVYAVGVALYRVLTGVYPFEGRNVVRAQVHEPPRDPLLVNPELPMSVGGVVLHALEKNPDRRHQTAGEVAVALKQAVGMS